MFSTICGRRAELAWRTGRLYERVAAKLEAGRIPAPLPEVELHDTGIDRDEIEPRWRKLSTAMMPANLASGLARSREVERHIEALRALCSSAAR